MSKVVTLNEARSCVEQGIEFRGTNNRDGTKSPTFWGEWRQYGPYKPTNVPLERCFCVFSYSYDWPILVFSDLTNEWYGNDEYYSNTTSRHLRVCKPHGKDIKMVGRMGLREIVFNGTAGAVRQMVKAA